MRISKTLQFLREGYRDESLIALKEWTGPHGEIGVYKSQEFGYLYLFILIDADNRQYYQHQYTPGIPEKISLQDAEMIATFAGATERTELEEGKS